LLESHHKEMVCMDSFQKALNKLEGVKWGLVETRVLLYADDIWTDDELIRELQLIEELVDARINDIQYNIEH
jgi:hypothetical protein